MKPVSDAILSPLRGHYCLIISVHFLFSVSIIMLSFHCLVIILSDYSRHARDCLEAWTNSSLAKLLLLMLGSREHIKLSVSITSR